MPNLAKNVDITMGKVGQTADVTEVDGAAIDMQGWDGCLFMVTLHVANAGNYLKVAQDTASGFGTTADLEGSKVVCAHADDILWVDVYKPRERYLRGVLIRAGAATASGDMYCIRYKGRKLPRTNVTTNAITGKLLVSPAEGTA